jgi:outer membrane biosynthesis protein TonB
MERAEATGLGVAVVAHVALLWVLTLAHASTPLPPPPAMEVSFVEEVGPQASAPAVEPSQAAAPELGPPEDAAPAAAEPPIPDPAQRPIPDPAASAPAPQPQRQAQPQPARPAQAQPQRPPARQSGSGDAQAARRRSLAEELRPFGQDAPRPASSQPSGPVVSAQVRASIDNILRQSLQPCQRQSLGVPSDAPVSRVRVTLTFRRNGTIEQLGTAVLTNADSRYARNYVDAAQRVARQCESRFRRLAEEFAEYYDVRRGWRQFRYDFPQ